MKGNLYGWVIFICLSFFAAFAHSELIPLTIVHTNDIHSHWRPLKGPKRLGGIGRISTTIKRIRAESKNVVVVDGGDWSEGNIYYNIDAGRTSLELLDKLGYDVAVVGNHDWLNGPDQLIRIFRKTFGTPNKKNRPYFVGANLNADPSRYAQSEELKEWIIPYKVIESGGLKIGVIGALTFELIFDKYLKDVSVDLPFPIVRKIAKDLKFPNNPTSSYTGPAVDLVMVLSHNNLDSSAYIAGTNNVDIVINAHDHVRLPTPIRTTRPAEKDGGTCLMVEAGFWGEYVGKLDLIFDTDTKRFVYHYKLLQQDESIPEDPEVMSMIARYDEELKQRYGNIFNDHIADANVDLRRETGESFLGNLLADSYRSYADADVAFEHVRLTSGDLYQGPIHTVDVMNAMAQIFDLSVGGRLWTLHTAEITGQQLLAMLNFVAFFGTAMPNGTPNISGVKAIYEPGLRKSTISTVLPDPENYPEYQDRQLVKEVTIRGEPLVLDKNYKIALPQGMVETVLFLNAFGKVKFQDTGVEDYRIVIDYLKQHTPIVAHTIERRNRWVVTDSDLAVYDNNVTVERNQSQIKIKAIIQNMGLSTSRERRLVISYDKTPWDNADDKMPTKNLTGSLNKTNIILPPIEGGTDYTVQAELQMPENFASFRVPVYVELDNTPDDPIVLNDKTWVISDPN
ncbi:MAG: bifunctional UDP-sugar hydrolase/5'-nucleotidase [Bacteriovoracia bacterium]